MKNPILPKFVLLVASLLLFLACQEQPEDTFTLEEARTKQQQGWEKMTTILERIQPPSFQGKDTLSVVALGAKNDSVFDSRSAIQQAIDSLASKGGGTVLVPKGIFFSDGPIHLKSNVNLHLAKEALLFFGNDPEKYLPVVKVRWEGTICYNYSPFIYAYQQKNIALTGEGVIDGKAKKWSKDWREKQKQDKEKLRQMGNDVIPVDQRVFGHGFYDRDGDGEDDGYGDNEPHYLRPTLLEFYECENVLLEDLTFQNPAFWTIHPVFSKNVTIRNLNIYGDALNDDGIDPDSSEDVLIEGCEIKTHDDAIAVKAGRDQDAWERPGSKNIIIRNNRLASGVNAFCIGSEMSGGVEHVFIEGNTITDGKHALNFKCNLDRGGQVQHIYFRNNAISSCEEAMFIFRMDYHGYRGNQFPTKFNDFYVSNLTCEKVEGVPFKIVGVETQPIERIYFQNISIGSAAGESIIEYAENILVENVTIGEEAFQLP